MPIITTKAKIGKKTPRSNKKFLKKGTAKVFINWYSNKLYKKNIVIELIKNWKINFVPAFSPLLFMDVNLK